MLALRQSSLRTAVWSCQPSQAPGPRCVNSTPSSRRPRRRALFLDHSRHAITSTCRQRPSSSLLGRPASSATSRETSSTGASPESASGEKLDWNTFFKLRKVRRRYNLAASVGTSAATTMAGISILSQQEVDAIGGQMFGLDPVVVLGLATAGFGALGWLAGPFFGNAVFNLVNRRYTSQIAVKEKGFFDRIKRYRVDPSSHSFSNPVPDYYGEKIASPRDYRQWLKDQRAYNKKRQSFV